MIRNLLAALALFLSATGGAAASPQQDIDGFGGLRFGERIQTLDWLSPALWSNPGCACERVYYAPGTPQAAALAGVTLYWPGLQYHFFENRYYAAVAEFPPDAQAFGRLLDFLTARYGAPDVTASWEDAPAQTYVHENRLRTAGWRTVDGSRSVWLISDDNGGLLTVMDNTLSTLRSQAIGKSLAEGRSVVQPPVRRLVRR